MTYNVFGGTLNLAQSVRDGMGKINIYALRSQCMFQISDMLFHFETSALQRRVGSKVEDTCRTFLLSVKLGPYGYPTTGALTGHLGDQSRAGASLSEASPSPVTPVMAI